MIILALCVTAYIFPSVSPVSYVATIPTTCHVGAGCTAALNLLMPRVTTTEWNLSLKHPRGSDKATLTYTSTLVPADQSSAMLSLIIPLDTAPGSRYIMSIDLKSDDFEFYNSTDIKIALQPTVSFIQTDKLVYQPTETVTFEVFCIRTETQLLLPCDISCKMNITVIDPDGCRVKQWSDLQSETGVTRGKLELAGTITTGDWKVKVTTCGYVVEEAVFKVEDSAIADFKVAIEAPRYYVYGNTGFPITVVSTYGKDSKVVGSLKMEISCSVGNVQEKNSIVYSSEEFVGTLEYTVKDDLVAECMEEVESGDEGMMTMIIVTISENLTGIRKKEKVFVTLYEHEPQLKFLKWSPSFYVRGTTYIGALQVVFPDGSPAVDKWSYLKLTLKRQSLGTAEASRIRTFSSYDAKEDGTINFAFDTTDLQGPLVILAELKSIRKQFSVEQFTSKTRETIQVSAVTGHFECGETARFDVKVSDKASGMAFYYLLVCRGQVIESNSALLSGDSHSIVRLITPEYSPECSLVTYIVINGEVLAGRLEFTVNCGENNPVYVKIVADDGTTKNVLDSNEKVLACVSAKPRSHVSLLAVDSQTGHNVLTYESLAVLVKSILYATLDDDTVLSNWSMPCRMWATDSWSIFLSSGFRILTDGYVSASQRNRTLLLNICSERTTQRWPQSSLHWLWISGTTSDNGTLCKVIEAPKESASLAISAFAMSSAWGLGLLAEKGEINVRKSLLISMDYPEVVKKGEEFLLIISVSNLVTSEQQTQTTLRQSNDFLVRYDETGLAVHENPWKSKPITITSLIKIGETTTVKVWIYPQVLGSITLSTTAMSSNASYSVEGNLMVLPEGMLETFISIMLIDLRQNASTSDQFVPLNILTNSGKLSAFVSDVVIAVANLLETALSFPGVFGAHNAISLLSDALLLKCLDESSMSSPDLRKITLRKMELTYQQQLAFRQSEGSFGALRGMENDGNLWLTSLTIKVLHQARSFIFVDDDVVIKATKWILMHQGSDGFFYEPSDFLNPKIQTNTENDRVAITAYVLIALVENLDIGSGDLTEAIKLCTRYLYRQIDDLNDVHTISIATYALHLANSTAMDQAHDILTAMAIIEDNEMYWITNDINDSVSAADIETTAYGLLVSVIRQDRNEAVHIWKWLSRQMKGGDGLFFTHAIAIALQALSQSSPLLIGRSANMDIKLRYRNHDIVLGNYQFLYTDKMEEMFLELAEMPRQTNIIDIDAFGYGTAALSVVSKYYKTEDTQTTFRMKVQVENHSEYQYSLQICHWSTTVPISGMSVTEVYGISGFTPDRSTMALKSVTGVKHVEVTSNRLTVYHDNTIDSIPTCMNVTFKRSAIVWGHQRGVVKTFNSQKPEHHAVVFYHPARAVRKPRMVADQRIVTQDSIAEITRTSQSEIIPHVFLVPNVCYTDSECVVALHLLTTIDSDSVCNVSLHSLHDTKFLSPLSSTSSVMTKTHTVATFNLFIPDYKTPTEGVVKFTLSNTANGFRLSNFSRIKIQRNRSMLLIKTDKTLYKQSETVKFRVICMKLDSKALDPCPSYCKLNVLLIAPNGYTVKRWANILLKVGVYFGEFHLADRPVTGDWMINASVCDSSYGKELFSVMKYVEPVFHIKLPTPSHHFIGSSSLNVAISVLRDFARQVEGEISITASFESEQLRFLRPIVKTSDTFKGNYKLSISDKDIIFRAGGRRILDNRRLVFKVKVREMGTNFTEFSESVVALYSRKVRFRFTDSSPSAYRPNTKYDGSLHVEMAHESLVDEKWDGLQITIRSETVSLVRKIGYYSFQDVDANGVIRFSFDTTDLKGLLAIEARLGDMEELKYVDEFRSLNKESIHVSLKSSELKCGDSAEFDVTLSSKEVKPFSYVFVCRGIMVENSQDYLVDGKYVLWHFISSIHSPSCKLLVFTEIQQEIIADSIHFVVDCVNNPVKIQFLDNRQQEAVSLQNYDHQVTVCATAKPYSVVALTVGSRIVPSGVDDVTSENIDHQLELQHETKRPALLLGLESLEMFQFADLRVLSNLALYKLSLINKMEILAELPITGNAEPVSAREKMRDERQFSETWLWFHGETGEDGKFCHTAQVPGQSATWAAFGFAISGSAGLGVQLQPTILALRRTHDVFMKYPLTVKWQEQFLLTISVMNYIDSDQTLKIILQKSSDFAVKDNVAIDTNERVFSKEFVASSNVEPKSGTFVDVWITPLVVGNITLNVDARSPTSSRGLKQVVTVVSAGLTKHVVASVLMDLRTGNPVSSTLKDVKLPKEALAQSGRIAIYLSVDLLASTLQYLEKLSPLPTGCGEQNLITVVPNTLVLRYLTVIQEEIYFAQDKARRRLEIGYQRQLTFLRKDNSFSAFGNSDESGSLWLTALVTKSFRWASEFIFIDQRLFRNSLLWILRQQEVDGSFSEHGRVLHPEMQGRHGKGKVSLTASVVIALQENKNVATVDLSSAIARAFSYLGRHLSALDDVYATAIVTYALHLVNNEHSNAAFTKLDSMARVQDGEKYWAKKAGNVYEMPSAVDIEATAYALLTTILRDGPDTVEIGKWLIRHSNGRGGFFSTQDTMVALHALTELASSVKSISSNLVVSVRFYHQEDLVDSHRFVNADKRFQVQSAKAPITTDVFKVSATGNGFAVVSAVSTYHQLVESYSTVHLSVDVKVQSQYAYTLKICHWSTDVSKTGMGVTEVEAVTGFSLRPQDVDAVLRRENYVKAIDVGRSQVTFYHDDIAAGSASCFSVPFRRKRIVASVQKACVKVFSFHEPQKQAHVCYLRGYRFIGEQKVSTSTTSTTIVEGPAVLSVSSTTTSVKPTTTKREAELLQSGATRLHAFLMAAVFEVLLVSF